MSDEPKDAFDELVAQIHAIESLKYDIEKARNLGATRGYAMKSLSISGSSYRENNSNDVRAAKMLQAELVARAVKEGEAERDKLLAQYAAKIESVRSALRSLVGPAVVALGVRARSIAP